ncbi:head maturation protease, ClpP-related [Limnovirga soli]|nr:head maturation protease, ClpP-related [Limnovirga soli]
MKKKFWIVNQVNSFTAEILLYGFIGEYEAIDDAAFITDLRTLENTFSTINIRVNCGGGDVYKGLTIFNAIRNSKASINGFVDGIAASMGAVIIAACTNVQMSKYARYMTHRVTGYNGGNADDMRNFADQLDQLENIIAEIIAKRTGLTAADAKTKYITNQDRWIGADQALQEKIIDGIYDAEPIALPATENNAQQLFNAYHKIFNISSLQKTENMKSIALLLGLAENATEQEVSAAISALITAKSKAENAIEAANKQKVKALVDGAIQCKQLTESDRPSFEAMALVNYDNTAAVIAKIPVSRKPTEIINGKNPDVPGADDTAEVDSWDKMMAKGENFVKEFKKTNAAQYAQFYKTNYGRDLPVVE